MDKDSNYKNKKKFMEIYKLKMNTLKSIIENRQLVFLYMILLWFLYKHWGVLFWVFLGSAVFVFSLSFLWKRHTKEIVSNSSIRIHDDFIVINGDLDRPDRIELNKIESVVDEYKYLSFRTQDGKQYNIDKREYSALDIYNIYVFLAKVGKVSENYSA